MAQLTNDAKAEEWTKYRELVIVPDGVLWYLPFEALPVPVDVSYRPAPSAHWQATVAKRPLRISYVGDARPEKGYQHLPQLADGVETV